jgi:hypothetical protein
MEFFGKIVEERIRAAQDEGVFDNLPGKGQALDLSEDAGLPEELRLAFKVLKNAHCLPPEMELRRELYSLGQLLNAAVDEPERAELRRRAHYLTLKLDLERERSRSRIPLL